MTGCLSMQKKWSSPYLDCLSCSAESDAATTLSLKAPSAFALADTPARAQ